MSSFVRAVALLVFTIAASAWAQVGPVSVASGGRQVTVTWTSVTPSLTEVAWGPAPTTSFGNYPSQLATSLIPSTTHSATLRRLTPGTWHLRVRSGVFESAEVSVTIPPADGWPLADWAFDGQVNALQRLGSSWYVGGSFGWVGPTTGGAFLTTDAGVVTHFPEVAGQVFAVAPDGTGGLYLGGAFSAVGGFARSNLAHLLPDLGVDPSFAPVVNGAVYAVHRSSSSVYLAGNFSQVNGQSRTTVAELSAGGVLQPWAPTILGAVFAIDSRDSVVYLGGTFSSVNGQGRDCLAAIGSGGTLQSWNPAMTSGCWVKGLQFEGGRLYVSGSFDGVGGQTQRGVAAIDLAGNLISSWRPVFGGSSVSVEALLPSGPGSIFVGGTFSSVGGLPRAGLALVDTDGGQPMAWSAPVDGGMILDLARDGTRLYVVGYPVGRADSFLLTSGAPVPWPVSLNGLARSATGTPSGIFVAGDFTGTKQVARAKLASIHATSGALEPWNPTVAGGALTSVHALTPLGNALVVGGSFGQINGVPRGNAAIVTTSGNLTVGWDPNVDGDVNAVAVAPSMILIGGAFSQVNGVPRSYGAMLDQSTGQPVGIDPQFNSSITAIAVEGATSYWVGGFGSSRGALRGHGAAFNLQTFALERWDPGVATGVSTIRVVGDRVALGGPFHFVNTWAGVVERPTIALFDRDAGALTATDLKISQNEVEAMITVGSTLYAGGARLTDAGLVIAADLSSGVVRGLDVRGQGDLFLSSGLGEVRALSLDCAGGTLGVAGRFFSVGRTPTGGLAALSIPCDAGLNLDAGATTDAGTGFIDAGVVSPDAGTVPDAGGPDDGGLPSDAGGVEPADGGFSDGGASPDAGSGPDAGPPVDAGAGPSADGGSSTDAGVADAGEVEGRPRAVAFEPVSCGCASLDRVGALLALVLFSPRARRRDRPLHKA